MIKSSIELLEASLYTHFFWNEYQLNPKRNDYNLIYDFNIFGSLDVKKLELSLFNIIKSVVLLNCHLINIEGSIYWEKNESIEKLRIFQSLNPKQKFIEDSFNLKEGPLYRFGLFKIGNNKYHLTIVFHRVLIDDAFSSELLQLISDFYNSVNKKVIEIDEARQIKIIKHFNNVVKHKVTHLDLEKANHFWSESLKNACIKNDISYLKTQNQGIGIHVFKIKKQDIEWSFIQSINVSIHNFLLAAFTYIMSVYCKSNPVTIADVHNVSGPEGVNVGSQPFLIPFSFHIKKTTTFKCLINEVNAFMNQCLEGQYGNYFIDQILRNSKISELNLLFAEVNASNDKLNFKDCAVHLNNDFKIDILGAELMLEYSQHLDEIKFSLKYNKSLFHEDYITQISNQFCHLLKYFGNIKNADREFSSMHILTSPQYEKLIYSWNQTKITLPENEIIISKFERQVENTPDNIALVSSNSKISYKSLNNKANIIAKYIIKQLEIGPESLIALYFERSEYMLIGILSVLKSGGAYVPIDLKFPTKRLKFIIDDTKARVILTDSKNKLHLERLFQAKNAISVPLVIDIEGVLNNSKQHWLTNPQNKATSSSLAYIIYTSGTTGSPKGVMIENKGVINLALSHAEAFGLNGNQRKNCLFYSNYAFDAHVSELYSALLFGHTLHVLNETSRLDLMQLSDYVQHNNISVGTVPPILLDTKTVLTLDTIVLAGDQATQEIFDCYEKNNINIINAYGPTEVTVCATLNYYTNNGITNIGKPIANTSVYVLSKDCQPVPPGVIGELYIGGVGVARGYLNNPKSTADNFIENPFYTDISDQIYHSRKLYKTGDLVRWSLEGNLEFVGRDDFQVKIKGQRIELGEIEHVLAQYKDIEKCIVILKRDISVKKQQYLVAYYVSSQILDPSDIKHYLKERLPNYMVPEQFIFLDQLPMTTNGKIDRNALPTIELLDSNHYVPPRNSIESKLCQIYAKILELPIARISIRDDFFYLGGDSIVITQLPGMIKEALNIEISVPEIFNYQTIESLYDKIIEPKIKCNHFSNKEIKEDDSVHLTNTISKDYLLQLKENYEIDNIEVAYLANNLQKGFIYHYLKGDAIDNAYQMQLLWQYNGHINIELLQKSWALAQNKYNCLRLKFNWEDLLIQIIDKKASLDWNFVDLSTCSASSHADKIQSLKESDLNKKFKLNASPLFRISIIKHKNDLYTCIFSNHHSILDGWSMPILLDYVHESYLKLLNGEEVNDTQDDCYNKAQSYLSLPYKDIKQYWDKYLSNINDEDGISLLADKKVFLPEGSIHDVNAFKVETIVIDKDLFNTLKWINKNKGVTLNAILQYAWHKTLNIYCNKPQTIVGTVVSGRAIPVAGIEKSVGLYINTLPLVVNHEPSISILDSIKLIQNDINNLNANSAIDLSELQQNGKPLFNTLFVYENHPMRANLFTTESNSWQNKLKVLFEDSVGNIHYPLYVIAYEDKNSIVINLSYLREFFSDKIIECLFSTFNVILSQINVNNINNKQLELLSADQYCEIERISGNYSIIFPEKPVHVWFEEQALQTPDNIAIVSSKKTYTYKDINVKSDQLSHFIYNNCISSSDRNLIAICMDSHENLVVSMLAILKAGAAYFTLNSELPEKRVLDLLQVSQVKIIITDDIFEQSIQKTINAYKGSIKVINIAKIQKDLAKGPKHPLHLNIHLSSLAYVMFTSGSTGEPKGVMITHKGIVSLVKDIDYVKIEAKDVFIQLSDISFDAATFEIWAPLLNGAKLFMPNNKLNLLADSEALVSVFSQNSISHLWLTKSLFDQLWLTNPSIFKNIKYLLIGGEALNKKLVSDLLHSEYAPSNVINGYGPTENTTFSCTFTIPKECLDKYESIPIGKPIKNRTAYVLNDKLQLLPIGAVGELYLGGAGLASGYINNNTLTKQKFINNPLLLSHKRSDDHLLYKTGDRVRWLPDGNLAFIGRTDKQVKLRGYRIELSEIECALLKHPNIYQCIATVKEQKIFQSSLNNKHLIIYYTASKLLCEETLITFLKKKLPEYMLPSKCLYLEKFPLTKNGKIDINALTVPVINPNTHTVPQSNFEKDLCKLWAEVLGLSLEQVGIKDDFFQLGGNSLLSIQLVNKLNLYLKQQTKNGFRTISLPEFLRTRSIDNINKLLNSEEMVDTKSNCIIERDVLLDHNIQPLLEQDNQKRTIKSIFLTGATGLLGSYLLYNLLQNPEISIYCLIREKSKTHALEKLVKTFKKYQLNTAYLKSSKLFIIVGDFSKDNFGLQCDIYEMLTGEIDMIIHNGALVNHIYPYELLRNDNVLSTKRILKFASTKKTKKINFISTLSVLNNLSGTNLNFELDKLNLDHGYVTTKIVSEIVLEEAKNRGFMINILRPGFIFSKQKEKYFFEDTNHFYSFISAILQFKKYPDLEMAFDITPVDFLSAILSNIIMDNASYNKVFNFSNPKKTRLQDLIMDFKNKQYDLEAIKENIWIKLIKNTDENNNLLKFASLYSNTLKNKKEIPSNRKNSELNCWLSRHEMEYVEVLPEEIVNGILKTFYRNPARKPVALAIG